MTRRKLAGWLLAGALAVHAAIAVVAGARSQQRHPDFDNYYGIGTRPGRPYVDFAVEFPVGTVMALRTIAPAAGDRTRFGVTLVAINLAADLAIAAALAWAWGLEAAVCYALVAGPIADLFFLRLDLLSTALATIGIAAWRRGRPSLAAIAFAAGAAFKLWPVMFLPLILVPIRGRLRAAPIAAAAATGVAVLGVWLWVAGPRGVYQVLTFREARGWEVESTVGGIWMLFDRSSMRLESDAWRIGATSGPISIALFALGAVPCLWMIWRGARTGHSGAGWAGGISALLVCSALLSPQFAAWLAPAAGVAWAEDDAGIAVLTATAVFLTNLVFKSFVPLLRGEPGALALVVARNALLAGLAIAVFRLIARSTPAPGPADPGR